MKIAFTQDPISEILLRHNIKNNNDLEILILSQEDILKKVSNGFLDGALVDPITYANLKKSVDVRIIPTTCLFLEDFTSIFGLNITDNYQDLSKLSMPFSSKYLFNICRILLNERYEIETMNLPSNGGSELKINDPSAILDLSEDWYESYKISLPLLFWVVKFEEGIIPTEDYVNLFNSLTISANEEVISEDNTRQGRIIRNWDSECEKSLDETLELLFYNNLVTELHCSKLYSNEE